MLTGMSKTMSPKLSTWNFPSPSKLHQTCIRTTSNNSTS